MVDVWLDSVTPKDSLLISCLLIPLKEKGYTTLVTARQQTQTTDLLELLNIPFLPIGQYGKTLEEKLVKEQERILGLLEIFDKIGRPKVLWTHGGIAATRTAFGLNLPIVYSNDTIHAIHVAKLITSLVDWLIAPKPFGKSWNKHGIPKSRIIHYDGIEEVAWIKNLKPETPIGAEELTGKTRVVLFRGAEYKASYYKDGKVDVWNIIEKLSRIATVVYLPRYEEEKIKLEHLENVWYPKKPTLAYHLLGLVDLVIGSGGSLCRESALMGIPTINFHFWDVIPQYLQKKGFPIKLITDANEILKNAKKILDKPLEYKTETKEILKELESPIPIILRYLEMCLQKNL
jgi:predicted glycosyltransferase